MMTENNDRSGVMKLFRISNILRNTFIICLIAGILTCIISTRLPSDQEKTVPIEYTQFSSELKTGVNCSVELAEDEIAMTIPTSVSLKNNGSSFLTVTVNYHLIKQKDGTAFFVETTDESNTNLTKIAKVESIFEDDFRNALSEGNGKKALFYGKTVSAPTLNTEVSYFDNKKTDSDNDAVTDAANSMLDKYPIICIQSTSPQSETVKTGVGIGSILSYIGFALIALAIVSALIKRFVITKMISDASHQYIK